MQQYWTIFQKSKQILNPEIANPGKTTVAMQGGHSERSSSEHLRFLTENKVKKLSVEILP